MNARLSRRAFLKAGTAATVAAGGIGAVRSVLANPGAANLQAKRSLAIKYVNPVVPPVILPAYKGTRYEARVPDTLDLAERAALAVHGLTAPTDPDADYEIYFGAFFGNNPPYMNHDWNDHCQIKWHEALPLMRLASGSHLNEEVDHRWMEVVQQMQGPDGLLYYPLVGRPWARNWAAIEQFGPMPAGDQYTEPFANGRLLGAIALYYQLTGDEHWKKVGEKVVEGLTEHAVHRQDYAYFSKGMFGVNEISDPRVAQESINPWINELCGSVTMGLTQFYRATGYEPAWALAGKLVRYTRYHGGMFEAEGRFVGLDMHFHGHLVPLLGMLEYGMAAGDWEMIQFVRKGFEFGIAHMWPVVGYIPAYANIDPQKYSPAETCEVADMIHMALKLTLAGAGDYWDDVDRWTRNQFAENQLTSAEWVSRMVKDKPVKLSFPWPDATTTEKVPERYVGGFATFPSPNDWQGDPTSSISGCCMGNGARAIYYIWENILNCRHGKLKVNLLLNCASTWADVDSYIPYEGRVEVNVKKPVDLSVRIPEWVTPDRTQCQVNGVERPLSWDGRYVVVDAVKAQDRVALRFPIWERRDVIRIYGQEYTLTRKGNEVVHIDPPGKNCALYQRNHYRANSARFKTLKRFVADQSVDW